MITCYVRYELDMSCLEAFAEYGRLWMLLIPKLGGVHHGYFVPSADVQAKGHGRFSFPGLGREGAANIGLALFSFPDWVTYERYRAEAGQHEECRRATQIVAETGCFTSYERSFVSAVGAPAP